MVMVYILKDTLISLCALLRPHFMTPQSDKMKNFLEKKCPIIFSQEKKIEEDSKIELLWPTQWNIVLLHLNCGPWKYNYAAVVHSSSLFSFQQFQIPSMQLSLFYYRKEWCSTIHQYLSMAWSTFKLLLLSFRLSILFAHPKVWEFLFTFLGRDFLKEKKCWETLH